MGCGGGCERGQVYAQRKDNCSHPHLTQGKETETEASGSKGTWIDLPGTYTTTLLWLGADLMPHELAHGDFSVGGGSAVL